MNYSVCITVYGKSPYLYDQLNSILKQSLIPSQIIVIEDYSENSAKNYIESFLINKNIPYKILKNESNIGPAESFRKGILTSDYDIIYFADHDDIWDQDRVANTINYHKENFMVVCNAKVFYENKNLTHSLYNKNDFEDLNILRVFSKNFVVGATISMNIKNYKYLISNLSLEPMHDWNLLILCILLKKKIKFVDKNLVSYRRHGKTLTGRKNNSLLKKIIFRIKLLKFIFSIKILIYLNEFKEFNKN